MTVNIIALVLTAVVSIIVPLVVFGILWFKNPSERKGIFLLFLTGAGIYFAMEWGIKEHLLKYLFNNTSFVDFMNMHYIPYLLIVALTGAVLTVIPEILIVRFACNRQMSFPKVISFALGYAMVEAIMLVGYRSIMTVVELIKDSKQELGTSTMELFLTGYERILIMLIRVCLVAVLVYFVQKKKSVRAVLIKVLTHTLISFLPGFFIAFSLVNYYEVYDRSVALVLVYVVLTATAFSAGVVLNSMKYSFVDKR